MDPEHGVDNRRDAGDPRESDEGVHLTGVDPPRGPGRHGAQGVVHAEQSLTWPAEGIPVQRRPT